MDFTNEGVKRGELIRLNPKLFQLLTLPQDRGYCDLLEDSDDISVIVGRSHCGLGASADSVTTVFEGLGDGWGGSAGSQRLEPGALPSPTASLATKP